MNVAAERRELEKAGSIGLWGFFSVWEEEEECINRTTTSGPATAFHYPSCPGKGELKGLFRTLSRQKAGYISSEPQLLLCSL